MPAFFTSELEGVATFWRIYRRDGIALGFTSHDRDLYFQGIRHRAAPGMLPSAIRKTANLSPDSAEVEGALSHDAILDRDLDAGLFDWAQIEIGAVNWETLDHHLIYSGSLGEIERRDGQFSAELRSAKAELEEDLVPRTSPTCRAEFCGKECGLSAQNFFHRSVVNAVDLDANLLTLSTGGQQFLDGRLRLLDGPQAGLEFGIISVDGAEFTLDRPIAKGTKVGTTAIILEGCDHTLGTCQGRFANVTNFRGEPFLPGNDLLARYGSSR
jgi:uncharacterized phage protein (TIGR02218 family)